MCALELKLLLSSGYFKNKQETLLMGRRDIGTVPPETSREHRATKGKKKGNKKVISVSLLALSRHTLNNKWACMVLY